MILEYEGFSKSRTMILEEAESISYAYVDVPEEYKKKIELEFEKEIKPTCENSSQEDFARIDFYSKNWLKYIKSETNAVGVPANKIRKTMEEVWNTSHSFIVVSLFGQGFSKSYIFEIGQKVYILNGSGKTIMKL